MRAAFINMSTGVVISTAEVAASEDEMDHGVQDGIKIALVLSDTAMIGDTWTQQGGFVSMGAPIPTEEKLADAMKQVGLSADAIAKVFEIAAAL